MIRLALRVHRAHAELVLAELLELAPAGVEEASDGELVEYAVYGAPGELPSLPNLRAAAGDALVEISTRELPDDWQQAWRRFHRPVLINAPRALTAPARRVPELRIRPPWEPASPPSPTREEIVIEPGQAFGTGAHASTRLCLELLLSLALHERRGPLLDIGTGSGVLAIAAARLGFAPVFAVDHERESIAAARHNAALNGVQLTLQRLDLRTQALPGLCTRDAERSEGIVATANLLAPLLLELPRALPSAPAHLIAGGLLAEQLQAVSSAIAAQLGMRERERRSGGEWAAIWLSLT